MKLVDYRPMDIGVIIFLLSMIPLLPLLLIPLLPDLPFPVFCGWVGVTLFGVWLYAKNRVFEAHIVVLPDRLLISGLAIGRPAEVLFATVTSYRYMVTRGGDVVRFKLTSGTKLKLIANVLFGEVGEFTGMVKSFMQAAEQFHRDHPDAMARDKNFF
ncbi:MAG: hypothetical protein M3Y54_06925 [Bacteroidota bacterium]|nr:hypothetical protein [Bacteroidota bacterium]